MTDSPLSNFNKKISTIIDDAIKKQAEIIENEETIIKIGVLIGFHGAREGRSKEDVLWQNLENYHKNGISPFDINLEDIKLQIQVGYNILEKNQTVTPEEVWEIAISSYKKHIILEIESIQNAID